MRRSELTLRASVRRARHWLREDQGYAGESGLTYSAEMRYRGQSFEIDTPLDPRRDRGLRPRGDGGRRSMSSTSASTATADSARAPIQVDHARLVISRQDGQARHSPACSCSPAQRRRPQADRGLARRRSKRQFALYRRAVAPGRVRRFAGPAVVAQDDCTTSCRPASTLRSTNTPIFASPREAVQ